MCLIEHIPKHLHWHDQSVVPEFAVGEHLYRRSPLDEQENPFHTLKIVDVSVNREGPDSTSPWCQPTDVLLNFRPDRSPDVYLEGVSVPLLLSADNILYGYYFQVSEHTKVENGLSVMHSCQIVLRHRPELCNYAHCAFQLYYDGQEVTHQNYSQGLGKHAQLRSWCKQELALLIEQREVWLQTFLGPVSYPFGAALLPGDQHDEGDTDSAV